MIPKKNGAVNEVVYGFFMVEKARWDCWSVSLKVYLIRPDIQGAILLLPNKYRDDSHMVYPRRR
jgi:hypothetical protein